MFGTLDKEQIENVLKKEVVGHLGCHANGITYVVPIGYAFKDNIIYGHTGEGLKMDIVRQHPAVCFQVESIDDLANWESVIMQGQFEEITDITERKLALQKLLGRDLQIISNQKLEPAPDWPFPPDDLDSIEGIVYRIRVHEISGRYQKRK